MRLTGYAAPFISRWSVVIGVFRSSQFRWEVALSVVRCCIILLLCCLIVGIHASRISMPQSLLIILGWSLMLIASLTLWVYQWESRSINFTSFLVDNGRSCGHVQKWRRSGYGQTGEWRPEQWGLKYTNHNLPSWYKWCCVTSQPHCLMKMSIKQLKRRDLHLKWLHHETNDNTLIVIVSTTMNNNLFLDQSFYMRFRTENIAAFCHFERKRGLHFCFCCIDLH